MIIRILKRTLIGLISAALIGALAYSVYFALQVKEIEEERGSLTVTFFDVGQGDSTYMTTPFGQRILVDGGPNTIISDKLAEEIPFFDKRIDIIVLTHPHADHVTGLTHILKEYEVQTIIHSGVIHTIPAYTEFLDLIREKGIQSQIVENPRILDLLPPEDQSGSPVTLEFLFPITSIAGERVDNLNNTSLVMRVVYEDTAFLLTGDAEIPVQREILDAWDAENLQADVLKVPHQGSKDSALSQFIRTVNPEYAVIFAGKDNQFGHPHQMVLDMLEGLGIEILRTDINGDITFESDGMNVKLISL